MIQMANILGDFIHTKNSFTMGNTSGCAILIVQFHHKHQIPWRFIFYKNVPSEMANTPRGFILTIQFHHKWKIILDVLL
jgi:hypothetical protein